MLSRSGTRNDLGRAAPRTSPPIARRADSSGKYRRNTREDTRVTTSKAAPAYLMLAALLAAAACGGGSSGGGSGGSSPAGIMVVTGFTPTTGARGDAIA